MLYGDSTLVTLEGDLEVCEGLGFFVAEVELHAEEYIETVVALEDGLSLASNLQRLILKK